MLDYIDVSAIDAKVLVLYAVILWLGWFTFSQTRRWFFATVLTLALLFGASRLTGVISAENLQRLAEDAGGSIDTAGQRAKIIGNQANSTSAGAAGKTNAHYTKHLETRAGERDF